MFFEASDFTSALSPKEAQVIASIANDKIDKESRLLHGAELEDNTLRDFGSQKEVTDTHSLVGILVMPKGDLEPLNSKLKVDFSVSEAAKMEVLQKSMQRLEQENKRLREKA